MIECSLTHQVSGAGTPIPLLPHLQPCDVLHEIIWQFFLTVLLTTTHSLWEVHWRLLTLMRCLQLWLSLPKVNSQWTVLPFSSYPIIWRFVLSFLFFSLVLDSWRSAKTTDNRAAEDEGPEHRVHGRNRRPAVLWLEPRRSASLRCGELERRVLEPSGRVQPWTRPQHEEEDCVGRWESIDATR